MGDGDQMADRVPAWLLLRGRGAGAAGAAPRRSKFSAIRAVSADGKLFASKAERNRYHILLTEQQGGGITELQLQPSWRFPINGTELRIGARPARYTADFSYRRNGLLVVEDVKGVMTPDAQLRIALMWAVHRIKVQIITSRR
jgi:hypothetical protein